MIEIAVKTTLVFLIAVVVNSLCRRASAAQRHAIWMLAFASVPLVILLPQLAIPNVPVVTVAAIETVGAGVSSPAANYIAMLWGAGTSVLLIRLALSFAWLSFSRERVTVPLTFGLLKPQIILPHSAVDWSPAMRSSVMLHEEAHIRRHDTVAQFFTQLICAVVWFQPLAWYAARRAAEERERACDDLVLGGGISPADYAAHLVEVARGSHLYTAAGVGMTRGSVLEGRLHAILNRSISRATVTRRYRIALLLVSAALVSGIAVLSAQDEKVYQVSDPGVTAPKVTQKTEPQYTQEARDAGIAGEVVLSLEINKEGRSQNIKVVTGLEPGLDKNAVAAINDWRFEPATREGSPVICAAKIKITFRLQ